MSTTIDNRVLEMRFDNAQFEKGVATSMSTLDKLKQKLNLSGASKGLENVGKAAKNMNFSGMTAGITQMKSGMMSLEGVSAGVVAKFAIIDDMARSLFHTGKRMASALTIDPVKTGFQEYETQIGAIQTILSNTRQEGTNVEIVNRALDELNEYADKTIYNFTEMTRNIGTFTAAGVKLDTSVNAIKGIANLAAVSGSTSQQASTAMYQLSQALAAGKVSLMDWNSVVNAGMGGKVFQDALVRTSELLGTGAKKAIDTYGSFRESLTKGEWLTTEVLTETLNQLSGAYDKADLISQGFTEEQANDIMALAKDAEDAATKVKTFTQLWDVMKEAAQSGWAQTWRIIVGDFEEAKALLTPLADFFTGIIGKFSDARNKLLEGGLSKNFLNLDAFKGVKKTIDTLLTPAKKAAETIDNVKTSIKDLGSIVDDVIGGKLGNGQERYDKLTESGYNWMEVQNKVNETLGNSFRYTKEQIEEQNKLLGIQKKTTESTKEAGEETDKLTRKEKVRLQKMCRMSEEYMRLNGYSEEQIAAVKELKELADQLGLPVEKLIANIDELNGRWLLINSFKNIGEALGKVFSSLGSAWRDVFDPIKPEQIFNAVAAMHKFTSELIMSDENADKLRSTFKGLFSALDLVATIAGGGVKIAFKALSTILGAFDTNILDITAAIGEGIYSFNKWLTEGNLIAKAVDSFASKLPVYVGKLKEWFNAFKETPVVEGFLNAIEKIKNALSNFSLGKIDVSELASSLGENLAKALKSIPSMMMQIGKDVIAGFQNGIREGISGSIIGDIISFCKEFLASFAAALGCHSPSVITEEIGKNTIQGFINGVKSMVNTAINAIKEFGNKAIEFFKNVPWSKLFAAGVAVAMTLIVKQIADAISGIAHAFDGFGELMDNTGRVLKSFSKVLNGVSWDLKAKAMLKFAAAIGILALAMIALSRVNWKDLLKAGVTIVALSGVLIGLAVAIDKMSSTTIKFGNGGGIEGLKTGLTQIGVALLLLAITVKLVGSMDTDSAIKGFIGLTALMVEMGLFMAAVGLLAKSGSMEHAAQVGKMMKKMAVALMLMVVVCKLVSMLSAEEMLKGAAFASAFLIFSTLLGVAAKIAGPSANEFGKMAKKMAVAMMLMVGVCKLVGMLSAEEMLKGAAFASGFIVFVGLLGLATRTGKEVPKLGRLLLSMSISMALLVGVCKLVGTLSIMDMVKGISFMGAFLIFVTALTKVVTIGNDKKIAKVSATILAMSIAIGVLAAVSVALSLVDLGGLIKGVAAVSILGLVMTGMVKALQGANNVVGSLIVMTVAIGLMAGAVAALSLIEPDKLAGATAAMSILMATFSIMAKAASSINSSIGTLAIMIIAVGMLAGVLYLLRDLELAKSIVIAATIGVLMKTLGSTMKTLSIAGKAASRAIAPMVALTIITGLIGLMLVGLSKLEPGPSLEIAIALSAVLLAISGAALILSRVGPMGVMAAKGSAALIAVVVGAGTILGVLGGLVAKIDGAKKFLDDGIPILESIGRALGSLIGGLIGGIGEGITSGLPGMIENIKEFMDGLSQVSTIASGIKGGSFDGVISLSEAMMEIAIGSLVEKFASGLMGESSMDAFAKNAIEFVMAIAQISMILNVVEINDEAISKVAKCGMLFSELANSLPKSGGMLQDIIGEQDLEGFGDKVKAFADEMLKVNEAVSGEGFTFNEAAISAISKAGTKFSELANALPKSGGMLQNIIGEQDLEGFGDKVKAFVDEMLKVNDAVSAEGFTFNEAAISAISKAGTKFSELANSLPKDGGMIQNIIGAQDIKGFGEKVKAFVDEMIIVDSSLGEDFSLNEAAINSLITAGEKFVELQAALPRTGGWDDTIMGKDDLETFGKTVGAFADALGTIKEKLGDDGITESTVSSITNAGNALVELQEALPTEGWFDGKLNLTEFSDYINDFSEAMADFGTTASGMDPAAISTAISAAYNMKYLIEAISDIDTSGVAKFTGVGTGGVGADGPIHDIAKSIADFSETIGDIDTAAITTSVTAAMRLKTLIANLSGLDTSGIKNFKIDSIGKAMKNYGNSVKDLDPGKVASSITSANRLKNFVASLVGLDSSGISNFKVGSIGNTMRSYSNAVKDVDVGKVSSSITAANKLKNFIGSLSGLDSSGISNFKIGSIGKSLSSYSTSVAGVDLGAISNSVAAANKLKSFISSLSGLDTSGVSSFTSAISALGKTNVSGLMKSFSGASGKLSNAGSNLMSSVAKGMKSKQSSLTSAASTAITTAQRAITSKSSTFTKAGSDLMSKLASGINSQKGKISSAVGSTVSSAASKIRNYYSSFHANGVYLGMGLVSGINSQKTNAYNAGYALGQAAVKGEKDGQKSNSPSKLTIQAGRWLGEGLVIGIEKMGRTVYNAGHNLGDNAAKSMSRSISKVSDMIDTGMDANPTIRPVLDLSDIQSGVGEIGSLFDTTQSIGVISNLSSINSAMNRRNQNGTNEDVVLAINKLRKDLGNVGNTTYRIDGITYDNGSTVSEAIETLVRATKIGRRK